MAELDHDGHAPGDDLFWNDSWDGYPAARNRITEFIKDKKIRNAVILTGDWHSTFANDIKENYENPRAKTVAAEFVTPSMSSNGDAEVYGPYYGPMITFNPHIRFFDGDRRGLFEGEAEALGARGRLADRRPRGRPERAGADPAHVRGRVRPAGHRAGLVDIRHGLPPARALRPAGLRPHPRHDDLRRPGQLRRRRRDRRRRRHAPDRHVPRRGRQPHRHRRRLLRRRCRRRSSARRSRAAATACCSPPRRACAMGDGPNDAGPLAPPPDPRPARRACAAWAPTTSTSTRCTSGTARRRSRRRSTRSTTSCDSGKVRYIGCSNYAGWQLMKALGISERRGYQRFVIAADLLLAAGARRRVRARARRRSTRASASSSGARSPAACCRASTAAAQDGPEGSRHLTDWNEPPVRDEDQLYDIVDVLVEIAEAHGVSAAQVALAWLLGPPGRHVA